MFFKRKADPIQIDGYQTYGTSDHLYIVGRALENEGVNLKKKGFLAAFKNAYKQFASDELRHAKLRVTLPDERTFYTTTDAEGYFKLDEKVEGLNGLKNREGWVQIVISFDDVKKGLVVLRENKFPLEMVIPAQTAEYGVISDIDDTILHTGVAYGCCLFTQMACNCKYFIQGSREANLLRRSSRALSKIASRKIRFCRQSYFLRE